MSEDAKILDDIGEYKYGFHDRDDNYVFKSQRGLSREVVENISRMKQEPQWMLDFRLKALEHYMARPMPNWGPSLDEINFDEIYYYVKPTEKSEKSWDDVPDDIKNTNTVFMTVMIITCSNLSADFRVRWSKIFRA